MHFSCRQTIFRVTFLRVILSFLVFLSILPLTKVVYTKNNGTIGIFQGRFPLCSQRETSSPLGQKGLFVSRASVKQKKVCRPCKCLVGLDISVMSTGYCSARTATRRKDTSSFSNMSHFSPLQPKKREKLGYFRKIRKRINRKNKKATLKP